MGGAISASSSPSTGSVFTFSLPMYHLSSLPSPLSNMHSLKTLVAEPDVHLRSALVAQLQLWGAQVECAPTAAKLLVNAPMPAPAAPTGMVQQTVAVGGASQASGCPFAGLGTSVSTSVAVMPPPTLPPPRPQLVSGIDVAFVDRASCPPEVAAALASKANGSPNVVSPGETVAGRVSPSALTPLAVNRSHGGSIHGSPTARAVPCVVWLAQPPRLPASGMSPAVASPVRFGASTRLDSPRTHAPLPPLSSPARTPGIVRQDSGRLRLAKPVTVGALIDILPELIPPMEQASALGARHPAIGLRINSPPVVGIHATAAGAGTAVSSGLGSSTTSTARCDVSLGGHAHYLTGYPSSSDSGGGTPIFFSPATHHSPSSGSTPSSGSKGDGSPGPVVDVTAGLPPGVHAVDASGSTLHSIAPPTSGPLTGKRLLIAEDNAVNLRLVKTILTKAGAACDTATNGADAVSKWSAAPSAYSAILMDCEMPVMVSAPNAGLPRPFTRPRLSSMPLSHASVVSS